MADMIFFLLFLTITLVVYNSLIDRKKKEALQQLEMQFLVGSFYFLQYKSFVLKLLEIVHEKASETDPKFLEDYKKIRETVEIKFNSEGDVWIKNLQKTLGYKTSYDNWEEATRYIEEMIKRIEDDQRKQND